MKVTKIDIAVVGGGCAGMSAALSAKETGAENIIIFERNPYLGGVLTQCIHNGFGIHKFHEDLTGTQYAQRLVDEIHAAGIMYTTGTFVTEITKNKIITVLSSNGSLRKYKAKSVILSTGCRERTRGALSIPGSRPAGVITAGAAQKYMNIDGYLAGNKIVILGSGDIGLIMARQFVLEGADVIAVAEIMPHSSGLTRNLVQCLYDFNIPIYYNTTVTNIVGDLRVEGLYLCTVDKNRKAIKSTQWFVECDTLVLSVGLIPEIELAYDMGIKLDMATGGAEVDDLYQTSISGVFSCGNSLHVHDLVDYVSEESEQAGTNAAQYVIKNTRQNDLDYINVLHDEKICGVVPQKIQIANDNQIVKLQFRPKEKSQNKDIYVYSGRNIIAKKRFSVLSPGEMCDITLDKSRLKSDVKIIVKPPSSNHMP